MNIGMDFDDTFTAMPNAYANSVRVFEADGATVFLVTNLDESHTDYIRAKLHEYGLSLPIVCCGGSAKEWVCQQRRIVIHNWWDDRPKTIYGGL